MSKLVTIQNTQLPVIEYKFQRVITTDMLAQGYGTDAKIISNNFNRNKDRFVEGKHYFKIEGEELRLFINHSSLRGLVSKHTNALYLWTERGSSRHAKMLETDQAWEWFEALEDSYFNQVILQKNAHKDEGSGLPEFRKAKAIEMKAKAIQIQVENAKRIFEWATNLSDNSRQAILAGLVNPIAGSEVIPLPVIKEKHYTATEVGKIFGVSANKIGRIANDNKMKVEEYGEMYLDKSRHSNKEVESFRYNEKALRKFEEILVAEMEAKESKQV
ncbi:ORF6N domain-containing protein [Arsenophonus sp.]|uniref:ORF6N domain-containing protein n=1 Tax=Arsenophonus sp. TaxID=1872640 RepID=UPI0028621B2B|nr:ORF6N domain-containing protein [Arsenophonus sp.]MDR5615688.1 ORF6N domain-containing protein [Arsenophonus sp.]MDR5616274.1 ORF6N domain-containing protein [Arsenophonus sp.]MDR5616869.1 ORF6N domain-containing protein [Arsenophonus sp.]